MVGKQYVAQVSLIVRCKMTRGVTERHNMAIFGLVHKYAYAQKHTYMQVELICEAFKHMLIMAHTQKRDSHT